MENNIEYIWNLIGSVEALTLRTYQENLSLTENLRDCEEKSPNKPPFTINYLEYYNSKEPVTSWIIRHIFAYTFKEKHPFFESFARTFLQRMGFDIEWIDSPIIDKDHEYKGIDILVRDKQYAVIIENKLKGASFQLNQLARYVETMRNEGYSDNQIFIVILPQHNISIDDLNPSIWKLPQDWESTNKSRKCRLDSYTCWCDKKDFSLAKHCYECKSMRDVFEKRTMFIYKELSEWLYNCIMNNALGIPKDELHKQYVLTSAVLQFVDFLNYIYQTRENDKYKMDIREFLSEQLKLNDIEFSEQLSLIEKKISDVKELYSQLESLYKIKFEEYIIHIHEKYKVHLVRDNNDNHSLYFQTEIIIDGVSIVVILGYEDGDYCQIETKSKKRLPNFIKEDFELSEELNDNENQSNCIWRYDTYKESLLRFDRVLGRLFDIKNNSANN